MASFAFCGILYLLRKMSSDSNMRNTRFTDVWKGSRGNNRKQHSGHSHKLIAQVAPTGSISH